MARCVPLAASWRSATSCGVGAGKPGRSQRSAAERAVVGGSRTEALASTSGIIRGRGSAERRPSGAAPARTDRWRGLVRASGLASIRERELRGRLRLG